MVSLVTFLAVYYYLSYR